MGWPDNALLAIGIKIGQFDWPYPISGPIRLGLDRFNLRSAADEKGEQE